MTCIIDENRCVHETFFVEEYTEGKGVLNVFPAGGRYEYDREYWSFHCSSEKEEDMARIFPQEAVTQMHEMLMQEYFSNPLCCMPEDVREHPGTVWTTWEFKGRDGGYRADYSRNWWGMCGRCTVAEWTLWNAASIAEMQEVVRQYCRYHNELQTAVRRIQEKYQKGTGNGTL